MADNLVAQFVSFIDGVIHQGKGVSAVSSPVQIIPVLTRLFMLMLVSYNVAE